MSPPQAVLFVCLGNICRSPAAEGVFLHLAAARGVSHRFRVDSAGTGGWHAGELADPRMRAAAAARGMELTHRARQLQRSDLDTFDEVLVMDADNLAQVRRLGPGRARVRPLAPCAGRPGVDHVADPYYGGPDDFEATLDLLHEACTGLLDELLAAPSPP
jgi:protein-tyrosine phosphatase